MSCERINFRDLGARLDGKYDDGAAISAALFARYGGLATTIRDRVVEVHASAGDELNLITPIIVRQSQIQFFGHGAVAKCTSATTSATTTHRHAFDFTQDQVGNPNDSGAVRGFKIVGALDAGIRGRSSNFLEVTDNWIIGCKEGLDLQGVQMSLERNYIRANSGVGAIIRSAINVGGGVGESQRCVIQNNRIWENQQGGLHFIDGGGHYVGSNDLEVNGQFDFRLQRSFGNQVIGLYGEPKVGSKFIVIDNDATGANAPGRTSSENQFISLVIGTGAVFDIDIIAGNNNMFAFAKMGIGNVRVAQNAQNTLLFALVGANVTNSDTSTMNWSLPRKLGGVQAISRLAPAGSNLNGFVDFSASETTKVVTFATAEVDPAYFVQLTAATVSGTPVVGSKRASVSSFPVASGFTIGLEAPPGTGNVVRVWWTITR
jgi:hypothetical protein